MAFLVRFLLVMLPALLATPALSGVERFTDLKGTIHITNNARPVQIQEQGTNVEPPAASFQPALPREESEAKPATYRDAAGTIHLTNAPAKEPPIPQAAEPAPAPLPPNNPTHLPVQPAAFNSKADDAPEGRDVAQSAASAPFQFASMRPDSGRVRKFKDRGGTIHITNTGAESGRFMLASGDSQTHIPKAGLLPAKSPPAEPENETRGLIKPASLALPPLPAPAWAAPAPPPPRSGSSSPGVAGVRRYRDGQGVIHLVSSPRPAPEDRGPPVVASAAPPSMADPREIDRLSLRKDGQGTLHLTNDTAAPNPRQARIKDLKAILAEASFWYGLPVELIEALIKVESNFAASAVSPKGAMGLMQLMPGTARDLGVSDPFCPRENVLGGSRYLRMLLDACHRSLPLALAAYNAGYRRVVNSGFKVPDIEETQAFVTQVLGHYYLAQKKKPQASTQLRL